MQLFCHPKYSILYGTLTIFVVDSGQKLVVVLQLYDMAHAVGGFLLTVARQWMTNMLLGNG